MSVLAAPPVSPFKGLAAFDDSELDSLFFFGREHEREIVVANMLASRLTILYGESGVGKSSLLGAAVVRDLREEAPDAPVVLQDTWSGSLEGVTAELAGAGEGYLILDQFEEYFLYHGDDPGPGTLLHDLPELLHGSRVNVLVSLREDALAQLDAFKARIPQVFANQVRLEHLDRESARAAILGPIGRWNDLTGEVVEIEPELVEAVLDEVAVEGRSHDLDRIEAPYLQLVLERLWETERAVGSELLRLQTLRGLGGAKTIVRDHLLRALAGLPAEQQDVAASMFEHLVTPSGTKIAHRAPDLAHYANVPERSLRGVLATLTSDRIVHSVDGSDRYEIFHDVLAEPIRSWRQERRLERERLAARRRQRRLVAVAAAALVALGVVAGLAVWAFSERSSARAEERHARARELEATALQQLTTDPNRSVQLALAAAHLEPNKAAESVLRQSIISDRLRDVAHAGGQVRAVAISPGGGLIAAAAPHGRVLVADAQSGRVIRTLSVHGYDGRLGFTDRGTQLVVGAPNVVAHTWSLATGRVVRTERRRVAARRPDGHVLLVPLRGHLARVLPHVQQLATSTDGTEIAAAVNDPAGDVRPEVFDRSGRLLRTLPAKGIKAIALSPDGRLLASAGVGGEIVLWRLPSGRRVRALQESKSTIEAVQFSPDGGLLGTAADDGVAVWDVATGVRRYLLFGHTNPVLTLAWSPDGQVLATGSSDRTVMLWRVQTTVGSGSLAATLAGDTESIRSLAFSNDGTRLVTGSDDGTARVWDAAPDAAFRLLGRRGAPVVGARWADDSIVAASTDGLIQVFDASTRVRIRTMRSAYPLTALAVAPASPVAVAGAGDGSATAWNSQTGQRLARVAGAAPISAVAVVPDGRVAASAGGGRLQVWDTSRGHVLRSARMPGRIADLAFSPGGDWLASAGAGGVTLWPDGGGAARRLALPGGATRVTFSADGRLLAAGGEDGTVRLWSVPDGKPRGVLRGHRAAVTDVVFSRDGRLLATSSVDHDGRIWSVSTLRTLHVLRGQFGPLAAIDFSPDGAWLVTAGPISAGIWPRSTGQQLTYVRGQTQLLTSVSFAPDGRTILSSSRDGTVGTYRCDVCVDLDGLIRLAERRLALAR